VPEKERALRVRANWPPSRERAANVILESAGRRGCLQRKQALAAPLAICQSRTSRRLLELLCSGLGSGPKLPAREMLPIRRRGVADPSDPPPPGLPPRAAASPDAAPAAAAKAAVRGLMAAADMAAAEPGVCGTGDAGCDDRVCCISGWATTGLLCRDENLLIVQESSLTPATADMAGGAQLGAACCRDQPRCRCGAAVSCRTAGCMLSKGPPRSLGVPPLRDGQHDLATAAPQLEGGCPLTI